jgi:hypothetical protein
MAPTEVKVKAAVLGTLFPSVALAWLNAVAADNSVLSGLPGWLQFVIITALPPVITFLSGRLTPSKTSSVSDGFER